MDTFPTDPTVLPGFAKVAQQLGRLEEARQALIRYAALVDDDRDQAARAARIGDLSLSLNDPASAVRWYEKSDAASAADAGLLARLADAYLRAGDVDTARSTLARAVTKDATNASVRSMALRIQGIAQPVPEEIKAQHQ